MIDFFTNTVASEDGDAMFLAHVSVFQVSGTVNRVAAQSYNGAILQSGKVGLHGVSSILALLRSAAQQLRDSSRA